LDHVAHLFFPDEEADLNTLADEEGQRLEVVFLNPEDTSQTATIIGNLKDGLPKYHKVVKGECLWKIAERYFSDGFKWRDIWDLNRDQISNPDLIYPGQILQIY